MISALYAVLAAVVTDPLASSSPAAQPANSPAPAVSTATAKVDPFANRPRARIAFARDVRNFQVKRDGYDDVLYLETRRDRWFRSEIRCLGIDDPRDAQGLLPLDHTSGFDDFSRIALVSFGNRTSECRLNRLVELTTEEAVDLRLMRRRAPPAAKAQPAS